VTATTTAAEEAKAFGIVDDILSSSRSKRKKNRDCGLGIADCGLIFF
jgi:hypothetical protein